MTNVNALDQATEDLAGFIPNLRRIESVLADTICNVQKRKRHDLVVEIEYAIGGPPKIRGPCREL